MQNICIICLNEKKGLRNLSEIDKNEVRIILKLRKCVPEVEWQTDFQICFSCLEQLENVCAFKDLCIKSYLTRKNKEENVSDVKPTHRNNVKKEGNSLVEGLESDYCDNGNDDDCEHDDEKGLGVKLEQSFVCYHCDKSFKLKNVLANHIKYEHYTKKQARKRKTFKCARCGKSCVSENALTKHLVMCQDNPLCEQSLVESKEEKSSVLRDFKIENMEAIQYNICDICGTSFGNKYLLKRHIRNVHATEKKFKCEQCDRKFASPVYLNAHKRYHVGERTHICSFCGKGYITASDLYHHEKIHANKRAYRCERCPKAFNTSSDLHKHKICVHLDRSLWKYECTYCQRRFPLKTNLDTHTKTHTGERNFLCHLCDRKCINRSVLKRHIESHSVVKSYKCHLCLHGYKYQKSLDVHLAKMHGIGDVKVPERVKKYFCTMCPKGYFANNKLQKHIRSHTGERPFQCPACDKCFIDKSYIKQHLKTTHGTVDFSSII